MKTLNTTGITELGNPFLWAICQEMIECGAVTKEVFSIVVNCFDDIELPVLEKKKCREWAVKQSVSPINAIGLATRNHNEIILRSVANLGLALALYAKNEEEELIIKDFHNFLSSFFI